METGKKTGRYTRVYHQLQELFDESTDFDAKLATIVAVLHHKINYFFWTGFYLLKDGELIVKTYQGPVACQILEKNKGVCWAGINQKKILIVPDVHQFPGHIACDSRSRSEIVIPLRDKNDAIIGVLDVDSKDLNSFDETDAVYLEKILLLLKK